jgi:hypothetical protein
MTDIRHDLAKTAEDLTDLAKEAAYLVIGIGILGFHKAQVRRQDLTDAAVRARRAGDVEGSLAEARKQVAKRLKDFDATLGELIKALDSTLDPMWQRLPEPAQTAVQQARDTRDQVRVRIFRFAV